MLKITATLCAVPLISFADIRPLSKEVEEKLREYNILGEACEGIQNRLSEVSIKYNGATGVMDDGLIIVHTAVAKRVVTIFNTLLGVGFPIGGVDPFKGAKLIDGVWEPDDDYNYCGSFNCRDIKFGATKSIHAFGMALDINPLYNPFIEILTDQKALGRVVPKDGVFQINRGVIRDGKEPRRQIITSEIVDIFKKNGFNIWGGNWDFPIDYMHFQVSKNLAILTDSMDIKDGEKFFEIHVNYYNKNKSEIVHFLFKYFKTDDINILIQKYKENPELFFNIASHPNYSV